MCAAWQRQRSDFDTQKIYRTIRQMGYPVKWEKASDCPCLSKGGSGQPDFNCPLCRGKGRYWFDPIFIQGIMTNVSEEVRYNQTGEIIAGLNYFTTLPENKLSIWDKISNEYSQIRYSEIIEKKEHNVKDRLRFKPITISSLRTVSEVYQKGIDFTVDTEGYVNWEGGGLEPNRGERYSVDYTTRPSWLVVDLPNVFRTTLVKRKQPGVMPTELPIKALVRLEFYL